MEMYEQQNPFKLQDFVNMSQFLNMFVYKSIMGQLFGECWRNFYYFIWLFYLTTNKTTRQKESNKLKFINVNKEVQVGLSFQKNANPTAGENLL